MMKLSNFMYELPGYSLTAKIFDVEINNNFIFTKLDDFINIYCGDELDKEIKQMRYVMLMSKTVKDCFSGKDSIYFKHILNQVYVMFLYYPFIGKRIPNIKTLYNSLIFTANDVSLSLNEKIRMCADYIIGWIGMENKDIEIFKTIPSGLEDKLDDKLNNFYDKIYNIKLNII